jgi:site-specific DNA-methyltransferase (adenine-specific)/modification methylase
MIKNESCMDTMAGMADKAVQCIITSPPYNMNLRIRNGKYCSRQIVKEFSSKYDGFTDNLPLDDFYLFHHAALSEMLRVSPLVFYNIAIVTGSKRAFFNLIGDFSDSLKDIIVWDKGHGQPAMQSGVMNRQSELILVFSNDAISRDFKTANFKRGTLSDTWAVPRQRSKIEGHGATFPEKLVETILDNFTRPGDLIYDPFMGSGTVLTVAKRMGRAYIGSEINENYCDAASRRMSNEIEGQKS